MEIDFARTGPQVPGNLNAPRAVTMAAVIYVLRTMVGAPIPLNSGCMRPVTVRIPAGSVLDPKPGAAVCGGNVETSQRIVDVLLGALGRAAASQGTMNNLTFGDDQFGYYETIAGGAGAGPTFDGASGVHTHMTNTRITDPELLETRFPVRLVEFSLRRGSGGDGATAAATVSFASSSCCAPCACHCCRSGARSSRSASPAARPARAAATCTTAETSAAKRPSTPAPVTAFASSPGFLAAVVVQPVGDAPEEPSLAALFVHDAGVGVHMQDAVVELDLDLGRCSPVRIARLPIDAESIEHHRDGRIVVRGQRAAELVHALVLFEVRVPVLDVIDGQARQRVHEGEANDHIADVAVSRAQPRAPFELSHSALRHPQLTHRKQPRRHSVADRSLLAGLQLGSSSKSRQAR
jgi:hypothetical protein